MNYETKNLTAEDGTQIAVQIPTGDLLGGYTRIELDRAFSSVQNPADWKAPIDCILDLRGLCLIEVRNKLARVKAAIEFFTATTASVHVVDGGIYRVTALGYRMGPAGDH